MSIAGILEELHGASPPFQPSININTYDYYEKLIDWNISSIKKGALYYQFKTGSNVDKCTFQLLPDACLNILFECDVHDPRTLFSGLFFEPQYLELKPDTLYFGIKPYSCLGIKTKLYSVNELANTYMDFTDAYPESKKLRDNIITVDSFNERIALFDEFSNTDMIDHDYYPTFVDYITAIICSAKGDILFNNLQQIIGYSERYIREKFKEVYGFSSKRYSEIIRFQNVLKKLILNKYHDLPSLAIDNGYFDQSHFIHEFNKFASTSPEKYRKNFYALTAVSSCVKSASAPVSAYL
ncbi:transcriptional regulator [Spirochaetia bacterium]|nr:transcriptional regulator [Spirochaetia bacterium]